MFIKLFFVIWVKSFYPSDDENDHEAWVKGQLILGIGNVVGLFSALGAGFLFEDKKKSNVNVI
jgi:hypothetical protein